MNAKPPGKAIEGAAMHKREGRAMIFKLTFAANMLIFTLPLSALAKKPYGEVADRRALAEVRTYCIDKSELNGSDRYVLDGFLKAESKPKRLLTKLPWKLVENCQDDNPDATATIDFVSLNTVEVKANPSAGPPVSGTDARDPGAEFKAILTVGDSSQKLLYRVEARPLGGGAPEVERPKPDTPDEWPAHGGPAERTDAIYHVFWGLINDLQAVRGAPTK